MSDWLLAIILLFGSYTIINGILMFAMLKMYTEFAKERWQETRHGKGGRP